MYKKITSIFLMLTLFLIACSESEVYIDEGDNWKISYGRDEQLRVEYIGEEPTPEEMIYLSIKQYRVPDTANFYLMDDGVFTMNITFKNEPDETEITLEWGDHTEDFRLQKH